MHTQAEDFYTHDSTTGSEQLQVFFFFFFQWPLLTTVALTALHIMLLKYLRNSCLHKELNTVHKVIVSKFFLPQVSFIPSHPPVLLLLTSEKIKNNKKKCPSFLHTFPII